MNISYRLKLLIAFATMIIIAAVWYFLILLPQQKSIVAVEGEIGKLNQQIRASGNTITKLPEMQDRVKSLDVEFDSLVAAIPTKDSIATITKAIVDLAVHNNLKIENIQPSLESLMSASDGFVKVPIDMTAKGSFLDLGHFVDGLSTLPFHFYQTRYRLEKIAGTVDLLITIDSYIYVLNTSSEG